MDSAAMARKLQYSWPPPSVVAMSLLVVVFISLGAGVVGKVQHEARWDECVDAGVGSIRFAEVGDTLYFDGTNHVSILRGQGKGDVKEVSEADYRTCNTSQPMQTWNYSVAQGGGAVVHLNSCGTHFFVSGNSCNAGHKLAVKVVDAFKAPSSTSTKGRRPQVHTHP